MSILVDRNTRVVVQGLTGREGGYHALRCREFGTQIVAGVTPGRGGTLWQEDNKTPVYNTMEQAVKETGANTSLIFVPSPGAADAIVEAADSGVKLIICITEGIPVLDMVKVDAYLKGKNVTLLGPNCPGAISPGEKCKVGIMPGNIHLPGRVGVVSRSGTLTYEAVNQLTELGIGQSSCVGIGGDSIRGLSHTNVLEMFNNDPGTDAVVMIGEIGGTSEQEAAAYIKKNFKKPVAFLIVGQSAPPGRRMGHAGAIITGRSATAEAKVEALKDAGAKHIPTPADIGLVMQQLLKARKTVAVSAPKVAARPAAKAPAARAAARPTAKVAAKPTAKKPAAKKPVAKAAVKKATALRGRIAARPAARAVAKKAPARRATPSRRPATRSGRRR